MSLLVRNLTVDQVPGKLEIKISFTLPLFDFDYVKIFRRTDMYHMSNEDENAKLIDIIYLENNQGLEVELIDSDDIGENTVYYYSIITIKDNNFFTSLSSQKYVAVSPIFGLKEIYYKNFSESTIKNENENKDFYKFITVVSKMMEYIHGKTHALELLFDIEKSPPEIYNNLAEQMGWEIDSRLSIDLQRQIVPNITFFYRWAGSTFGLARLVKFYSGYPDNTGILETASKILFSPKFNDDGAISFLDKVSIDFINDNLSLIGTLDDPLFYCYDFKINSIFNSNSYIVYFKKPQNITQAEVDKILSILNDILSKYSPLGVNYDILVL